jgi:FMN phosphatase YigB (HAD superfamily)
MEAAILFDFGGTLDYPEHWLDRFLRHYRAAGLRIDRATLDRAFTVATGIAYRSPERMRELGLEATIHYLASLQLRELATSKDCVAAAIDAIGAETLAASVSRSFAGESRAGLAASGELLGRLSEHYKLGVISNFYGNLERILDEAGMSGLFDFVGDSSRFGSFKPDRGMFHAALRELQIEPHRILMAGDSLDKDCAPARAMGMRTAWLRYRSAPPEPQLAVHADFTIGALAELEHLSWTNS